MRHGPHQAAQQSSSTGSEPEALTTSRSKLSSVTVTGLPASVFGASAPAAAPPPVAAAPPSAPRRAPHLPHTGCLPTTVTRSSTRFFAPHFPQVRIAIATPPASSAVLRVLFACECDTTARRDERASRARRAALNRKPLWPSSLCRAEFAARAVSL